MLKKSLVNKKPYFWANRNRFGGLREPLSTQEYGFLFDLNQYGK
jgi:hypothetical protein